ncbi:MAG: PotD/PotF family extracellular solute-binding protein [Geminicoccaceae bacterium]
MSRLITPRRTVLQGAAALAGTSMFGAPAIHAQERTLKVAVYGGYFKDSFDQHIFPKFTADTGIAVESVAEPTSEAWVVQLEQAARAGRVPADVNMISQTAMLSGQAIELWAELDESKLPNMSYVTDAFVHRYPDGRLDGLGAVAWFITLCTNTDAYPQAPESWAFLWDPANEGKLGLLALASNSFLLEVTAATYFDGHASLKDEESILQVMDKLAEVKPNVALWYRDEGQFQAALESGEIPAGQYYHDVTGLIAADGKPVRSTFPKEGGISDSGCWAVPYASDKMDEAHVFIDYMCQPSAQALLSRMVGTAPIVARADLDLTDEEFAAVASEIEPIVPAYAMQNERKDWLAQMWSEKITG